MIRRLLMRVDGPWPQVLQEKMWDAVNMYMPVFWLMWGGENKLDTCIERTQTHSDTTSTSACVCCIWCLFISSWATSSSWNLECPSNYYACHSGKFCGEFLLHFGEWVDCSQHTIVWGAFRSAQMHALSNILGTMITLAQQSVGSDTLEIAQASSILSSFSFLKWSSRGMWRGHVAWH